MESNFQSTKLIGILILLIALDVCSAVAQDRPSTVQQAGSKIEAAMRTRKG